MQYDIQRFLDGGYCDASNFGAGLHVTFETKSEALDFVQEIEHSYPRLVLGALDFSRSTFFNVRDRVGYVYYKTDNRILRTINVNANVPLENIIPASDLLIATFDKEEVLAFLDES